MAPMATVDVSVPDPTVEEIGGAHRVSIAGEEMTYEEGKPQVPVYTAFFDYPARTQIQQVRLVSRSTPQLFTNLNIPAARFAIPGSLESKASAEAAPNPEWWPEKVLKWHVVENPYTSTLALTIYPFYYNSLIHEGLFYKDYMFDIQTTESPVEVTQITTDADTLPLGGIAKMEVEIENHAAQGAEVTVRAVMENSASGEMVDGLLLKTLTDLQGKASFALEWSSAGKPAADYAMHVEVLDAQGHLLDQAYHTIQVGLKQADLTALEITPTSVLAGEPVQISFFLHNTGELPITGTVELHLRNAAGENVETYTQSETDLPPEASLRVAHTWQTGGLAWGRYSLVAYLLYNGQASNVLAGTIEILAPARLFLPVINK